MVYILNSIYYVALVLISWVLIGIFWRVVWENDIKLSDWLKRTRNWIIYTCIVIVAISLLPLLEKDLSVGGFASALPLAILILSFYGLKIWRFFSIRARIKYKAPFMKNFIMVWLAACSIVALWALIDYLLK